MAENNGKIRNLVSKTLFVVGIIIVILILAFAIIRVVPRLFSSFATVGDAVRSPLGNRENYLQIEGPDRLVDSGETTFLDWDYEPTRNGVYEISYECSEYLEMVLGTADGNKDLNCNTTYFVNPTAQSISLIPTLTRENVLVDVPFNISYVDSDGEIVTKDSIEFTVRNQGAADLAGSGSIIDTEVINPGSAQNNNTNNQNTPTTQTQTTNNVVTTPRFTGLPDLAISNLIEVDDAIVAFTVSNIGSSPSGVWFFNYRMPDNDVELSPSQPSLMPGDAIRYTLRFEDIPDGRVTISVDPFNGIREIRDTNNVASVSIDGDNGSGSGRFDYDEDDDADLEIENLEVGRMSGSRFVEDDEIDEDDDAAIRFTVVNRGGEDTGRWRFTVDPTPYDDEDEYESNRQDSLDPGESVTIIVEFENPDEGRYDIEVEVDSDDDVDEENERNNTESERLEVRD